MTTNDIHSLIAPYALDALDADERARFETHLEHCEECGAELAGFMSTAARLGDVPSLAPPAELKSRVMAQVARTPQERPIVTALSGRSRLRRTLPRLVVAAATLIALVGLGAFGVEYQRNSDLRANQSTLTQVLTATDARSTQASLKAGGGVRMIVSESKGLAVVMASDLPAIAGKTYQLWTIRDGHARSEGILGAASHMLLVKDTAGAQSVAITIEPAGGSTVPTTAPIAAMPI